MVPFEGKCYELGKSAGCTPSMVNAGGALGINATTLEVECVIQGDDKLSIFVVPPNAPPCPPGSRRTQMGDCREED